ncbi:MAG: tetratricopeptide repeat protein [Armatimonadota bacterium]
MKTPSFIKLNQGKYLSDVHIRNACELEESGQPEEAISALNKVVKRVRCKYPIYRKLAELHKNLNHFDAAEENLNKVLDIRPDDIESREMMLEIYLDKGELDNAIKHSRELIRISPSSLSARDVLYFAYLQKGMLEKALQVTNEMIKLNPLSPVNHYKRAFIHHEKGDISAAIHELSRVLEMSPDEEMEDEAVAALEQLDSFQIRHILMLAIEDFIFRTKLIRDPESAAMERGYFLSYSGMSMLRQIEFDDLPEIYTEWKQRYYH